MDAMETGIMVFLLAMSGMAWLTARSFNARDIRRQAAAMALAPRPRIPPWERLPPRSLLGRMYQGVTLRVHHALFLLRRSDARDIRVRRQIKKLTGKHAYLGRVEQL